jgi:hypothetical protein
VAEIILRCGRLERSSGEGRDLPIDRFRRGQSSGTSRSENISSNSA